MLNIIVLLQLFELGDIGLKDDSNYFYNKGYNKYYRNIDKVKGINLIKIYINDNLLTLNLTNINDDDLKN